VLTSELKAVHISFILEETEKLKNMAILPAPFMEVPPAGVAPVYPKYLGEGEPLPHGDPPIPITGQLTSAGRVLGTRV
jgi:hypothetical protein